MLGIFMFICRGWQLQPWSHHHSRLPSLAMHERFKPMSNRVCSTAALAARVAPVAMSWMRRFIPSVLPSSLPFPNVNRQVTCGTALSKAFEHHPVQTLVCIRSAT